MTNANYGFDIANATVAALREFALNYGLEFTSRAKKADIVAAIEAAREADKATIDAAFTDETVESDKASTALVTTDSADDTDGDDEAATDDTDGDDEAATDDSSESETEETEEEEAARIEAEARADEEEAARVEKKRRASNSLGVAISWTNPEVKAARLIRDAVTVETPDGNISGYRSTREAFRAFRLPDSVHIRFRLKLKASKDEIFEYNGVKYRFRIAG
jgi:hypothetical protein